MKKNLAFLILCIAAGHALAQKLNIVPTPLYCNPVFEKQHQAAQAAAQMPNRQAAVGVQLSAATASALRSASVPAGSIPAVVTASNQAASNQAVATATPPVTFAVKQRETVREAIGRWAKDAGWVHLPEHYAPDFDVQILGDLKEPFTDFKVATRELLNSTSMTSRALQPCFYSNNVVRVILKTQRCDVI